MFRFVILCFFSLVTPVFAESQTVSLGDRSYRIDLPPRAANAPIILALHGGGGNPDQFARNAGLSRPANAKGYAVIYPAGSARGRLPLLTWNAGYCCGYASGAGIDDPAFLDAVIADAARRFGLNGKRIYLTGMSNGSMMAERYGAMRAGRVKAVAGVAGTMDVAGTRIKGPVPLLHIHGTADTHVQYDGGYGPDSKVRVDFASVDQVIAAFVGAAGRKLVKSSRVIDPVADDSKVLATDYSTAQGVVMVRLLAIEGGGHVWPGGQRATRGGGTRDIDANTEVLRFFALHP